MRFTFDPERATQAAALLVGRAGGALNYTKLIKLLYLADRKSLVDTGMPITGDRCVNMDQGPVLSTVYRCINGERQEKAWNASIKKNPDDYYEVVRISDPGRGELSDFSVQVLNAIFDEHKHRDWRQMVDFVHKLPEWKKPGGPAGSTPLTPESILLGAGVPESALEDYEALSAASASLEDILLG